jgi:hypothetical protein
MALREGGFHFLAIMKKTCYKRLCTSFYIYEFSLPLGIYLGVELLGQIESLFLLLKELPNCFPK